MKKEQKESKEESVDFDSREVKELLKELDELKGQKLEFE